MTTIEKEPSVASVALKYGLLFGLVGVVFQAILMVTNLGDNRWLSSLGFVILIVGIVLAMKSYKEQNLGYMSYGQGLGIGALLSGVYGFCTGLFSWIYMEFVDPEYMGRMMEKQRVQMLEQGLSDEQVDAGMAMAENFQGPLVTVGGAAIVTLIFGFFLSLIISAIIKNSRPEFE